MLPSCPRSPPWNERRQRCRNDRLAGRCGAEARHWHTLHSGQQADHFDTAVASHSMEDFAGRKGACYFSIIILLHFVTITIEKHKLSFFSLNILAFFRTIRCWNIAYRLSLRNQRNRQLTLLCMAVIQMSENSARN